MHDRLEELITDRGRELLRQLLQDHFDLRMAAEESRSDRPAAAWRTPRGPKRFGVRAYPVAGDGGGDGDGAPLRPTRCGPAEHLSR